MSQTKLFNIIEDLNMSFFIKFYPNPDNFTSTIYFNFTTSYVYISIHYCIYTHACILTNASKSSEIKLILYAKTTELLQISSPEL